MVKLFISGWSKPRKELVLWLGVDEVQAAAIQRGTRCGGRAVDER